MSRTKYDQIQVGDVVRRRPEWHTKREPDASVIGTLRVTKVDDVGNGDLFWTEEFGPNSSLDQQAFEIVLECGYFFSQPDAQGEPTIWLEVASSTNAVPMLRRAGITAGRGEVFEDRDRLWTLIEHAIASADIEDEPTPSDAVFLARLRMGALEAAEKFIQSGHFLTRPLQGNGLPMPEFRALTAREHLDLVLEAARFLLGEDA